VTDAGKKVPPIVSSKPITAQINSIGAGIIIKRHSSEGIRQKVFVRGKLQGPQLLNS
jgi:hypothetical protein